jgi:hypothetical protein
VEAGHAAERGDDAGVEPASADGGVAEVGDRVPRRVEPGEGGSDGHGLAGATSPVITPRVRSVTHQPMRATASARAVAAQHLRRQRPAERGAGETVVRLQFLDHAVSCWCSRR